MPGVILLNPITGTVNLSEPITGTVGLSGPITGAVKITEVVQVSGTVTVAGFSASFAAAVDQGASGSQPWKVEVENFPSFPAVQTVTGSVALSEPVTGAVKLTEAVLVRSGSYVELLLGGNPLSLDNPIPITGSHLVDVDIKGGVLVNFSASLTASVTQGTSPWVVSGTVALSEPITGTVGLSGPVTGNVGVTNFPAVQAVTGTVGLSGPITGTVGISGPLTGTFGLSGPITGAVKITEAVQVVQASGTVPWQVTGTVGLSGPITGAVALTAPITGTVGLSGPITGAVKLTEVAQVTGTLALSAPITGTVGLSGPITGAVKITEAVQVVQASGTVPWQMTGTVGLSGPITGAVKLTEVAQVTGTVGLSGPITGTVGLSAPITGSVGITGPLTGTFGLSGPITGTVGLSGPVTGNVGLTGPVAGTSFRQVLLSASSLGPGAGFVVIPRMPYAEPYAIINIKGPLGNGATASFYLDELDPVDQFTFLRNDDSKTVSGSGIFVLEGKDTVSDCMRLYWQVTGSFTGTNAAAIGRWSGNAIEGQSEDGLPYLGEGPVVIGGVDGSNNVQSVHVDSAGNLQVIVTTTPPTAVPGLAFGDVASGGTFAAIRRTAYTEQTGSFFRSLVSSASQDRNDAPGGNGGARQVKITYLDATGSGPFTEIVNMSGTNPSNTVNSNICFIEKLEVITVGVSGSNQGIISLYQSRGASGSVFATIALNDNRTFWAHHYCPVRTTSSITGMDANSNSTTAANSTLYIIKAKALPAGTTPENQVSDVLFVPGAATQAQRLYGSPLNIFGPALITCQVQATSGNPTARGSFDFYDQII